MINGVNPDRVYLASGPTDLRKSIDGLDIWTWYNKLDTKLREKGGSLWGEAF